MTDRDGGFYLMAFNSASHSIQTEKKAKESFRITVMPTPMELTNDCGLAIKFLDGDIGGITRFHETLTVPANLYFLSDEKIDGKRRVEKII